MYAHMSCFLSPQIKIVKTEKAGWPHKTACSGCVHLISEKQPLHVYKICEANHLGGSYAQYLAREFCTPQNMASLQFYGYIPSLH